LFVKVNQEDFSASLQVVQRAASLNTTLPILTGVLLKTKKDQIELRTTDLELTIISFCPAVINEEGTVVVPAKLILDIFKHLPPGTVNLKTRDGSLEIESGGSSFKIKTMSPEDFPKPPEIQEINKVVVKNSILTTVLKQIIKSISKDESRPVLTGAFLGFNSNFVEVVATDSYRLALKKVDNVKVKGKDEVKFSLIVPAKVLEEVQRQLSSEGETEIITDQTFIKFVIGKNTVISRLLDGQFPNYEQLISKEWAFNFSVNGEELVNSISRVALIAQKSQIVKLLFQNSELELQAAAQGVGEAKEKLKVKTKGQKIEEVAFNAQYLIDGIQACLMEYDSKEIIFKLNSATSPGIITTKGSKNFLYLVMPLRV